MRKERNQAQNFYRVACSILFALLLFVSAKVEARIPEIILKQKKAVVTIYISDKYTNQIATGSGFVVDPSGIIATNFHIASKLFEEGNTILFKMENGSFLSA